MNKNKLYTIIQPYMLLAAIVATATAVVVYLVIYAYSGKNLISTEQAVQNIKNNKYDVIMDVRTQIEYNLGNYQGSVNIPIDKIKEQSYIESNYPNKNIKILIYCNTGQRARQASETLNSFGYKNVDYIAGTYLGLL